MSWLPQVAIMLTGVTAIALSQSANPKTQRYACLFGLAAQPFWFWATISAGQWGIAAMCCLYTLAWARGVRTHWLAGLRPKRWPCAIGLHRWRRVMRYGAWEMTSMLTWRSFRTTGWWWHGPDACGRCGKRRGT